MGDRVGQVSSYGESEMFQIMATTTSSDTSDAAGSDGGDTDQEDVATADTAGEEDGGSSFPWGVVIGAVAGAPPPSQDFVSAFCCLVSPRIA